MARYEAECNGASKIRSSSVVLTHAWACKDKDGWYIGGFSTSEGHAKQSIEKYCSHSSEIKVVPAIKIDDVSVAKQ
jgi:hypothetical protein